MTCLEKWENENNIDYSFINDHFTQMTSFNFIEKMKNNEPFSYVRLGDLEWRILLHNRGNDEHFSNIEIQNKLKNILSKNVGYYVSFSYKLFITTHVYTGSKNMITTLMTPYKFVDSDVFNNLIRYENINYFELLEDVFKIKNIVHIGNEHILNIVPTMINIYDRIIVSKKNCYINYDIIKSKIIEIIDNYTGTEPLIFAFCSSVMSVIMIDDLYNIYGTQHTFIDYGSFFDFFLGFASRTPTKCAKENLFNIYNDCMSVNSIDDILDISMSLV
jgi:hypothetical protein